MQIDEIRKENNRQSVSYGFAILNKNDEFYSHTTKSGEVVFGDWDSSKVYASEESASKALKRLKTLTSEKMIIEEV